MRAATDAIRLVAAWRHDRRRHDGGPRSRAGTRGATDGGAGSTGGNIWQVQYVYNASKRTEFTVGYVSLQNDANARYTLGGLSSSTIQTGQNQNAIAVSMKNTF